MSTLSDSVFLADGSEEDCDNSFAMDRYSRFFIYVKNAIEDVSSGVSEEDYQSLLGQLKVIKKSKSAPGKMQKKMRAGLVESMSTEMQETIKEEKIKENLRQLDKLVEQSVFEEGEEAWRPNGNVKDHMRSHVMEAKLKHKDVLEKAVREKEQDLECELRKVNRLRAQVRSLESRLVKLKELSNNCSLLDAVDKKVIEKVEKEDSLTYFQT